MNTVLYDGDRVVGMARMLFGLLPVESLDHPGLVPFGTPPHPARARVAAMAAPARTALADPCLLM